jgi:hypothetical protein
MKTISKIALSMLFVLVIACDSNATDAPEIDIVPTESAAVDNTTSDDAKIESQVTPANALIRLIDPLDDPGHYCIDVAGFGRTVRLQSPLQAHTCKPNDNRDQQFTLRTESGQLYIEEYDLCLQPDTITDGAEFFLRECSDNALQKIGRPADGTIRLLGDGTDALCVAVVDGVGHIINDIHKRRELIGKPCSGTDPTLITWAFSTELVP